MTLHTYPAGGFLPWRRAETRIRNGRDVLPETIESPGIDGRLRRTQERVAETAGARIERQTFDLSTSGRRILREASVSEEQTLPDGSVRTVENTSVPDLEGRVALASRRIVWTRPISVSVRQTDAVVFRPGIDGQLQAVERLEQTEHALGRGGLLREITVSTRDVNGRFQPSEARVQHIRTFGTSETVDETTVRRRSMNGRFAVSGRNIVRRSGASGRLRGVIETFDAKSLIRRLDRTTMTTPDGGRRIVEDFEARVPGWPTEPIRLSRVAVEVISRVATEQWKRDRQVFDRDVNARLDSGKATLR